MRKISGKVVLIFLLMFVILVSSVWSSLIATNTQEQHVLLTEVMMETKVKINRVTLETAYLSELRASNLAGQAIIDERLRALEGDIESVHTTLENLGKLMYPLPNGHVYDLRFDGGFEPLFLEALGEAQRHFDDLIAHIDLLRKDTGISEEQQAMFVDMILSVNESLDREYGALIQVCKEAAVYQKQVSDTIQLVTIAIGIGIFILLIPFILNNLYKPIVYIRDSFQSLSKGDLSRRFERRQDDEFKDLYDNFNYFLDRLDQVFAIEDNIIQEDDFEQLLRFISTNLKTFMRFTTFGFIYFNYNNETIHYRMTEKGMVIDALSDATDRYEDIVTIDGNLIVPIKMGQVNVGHYYFENYEANIKESRFIHLFRDKLTTSFYKNILVKDLLNIVTDTLADTTEAKDPETAHHLTRMSQYAYIVAKKLMAQGQYTDTITSPFVENILVTAPMHDIGKMAVPDSILLKPGRLTEEEFDVMKTHAVKGGDILANLHRKFQHYGIHYFGIAATIAYNHHEKFDGSGYPKGLKGQAIPVVARITAIADVFDALTSKRPYKEAFTIEKSVAILEDSSGSHFDPAVVSAFTASLPEILEVYEKYKEV